MAAEILVQVHHHGGHGGGFTGAGNARQQGEATLGFGELEADGVDAQLLNGRQIVFDVPHGHCPFSGLGKNVHTEPAKLGVEVREIDLPILLEILHKVLGAHAEDDSLNPFFGRLGKVAVAQATAHAEVDVLILLDVKVGHVFIDGILQNEIEKAQVLVLNGHVRLQTVPALGGFIGYTEITGGETQANVLVLGQLHAAGGFVLGPVFEWDFLRAISSAERMMPSLPSASLPPPSAAGASSAGVCSGSAMAISEASARATSLRVKFPGDFGHCRLFQGRGGGNDFRCFLGNGGFRSHWWRGWSGIGLSCWLRGRGRFSTRWRGRGGFWRGGGGRGDRRCELGSGRWWWGP